MMTRQGAVGSLCAFTLSSLLVACSGTETSPLTLTGGSPGVGGNVAGSNASGGASMAGGNSVAGGTLGMGGNPGQGGIVGIGGNAATGGSSVSVGGSVGAGGAQTVGGVSSTGGNPSTGGAKATGGASAVGGAMGIAGSKATGGASNAGGGKATGGTPSTGGTMPTGGTSSVGGVPNIGGTAGTSGKPYKGVANSPCVSRTNLKVSWYYNWGQSANEPCSSPTIGGEFVPMIWGHSGTSERTASGITGLLSTFVSRGNTSVLGFNEPENCTNQSCVAVAEAITLWPSFNNPSLRVGTASTSAGPAGVTWFNNYMTQLNANTALRADFLAVHWYGWSLASCDAAAVNLDNYLKSIEAIAGNRPIWLTEWGCLSLPAGTTDATTIAHMNGAIAMFARHPRLERYAWYPWAGTHHSLNNADGSLTALGQAYAAAPAFK